MTASRSTTDPAPGTEAPATDTRGGNGTTANQAVRRGRPSVAEAEQLYGKILEASWQVLLDTGLDTFTFDRVARRAHIGKATIYARFAGKRELMEALVHHGMAKRRAAISAMGSNAPLADAFRLRAVETLELLHSPDGKLMERLIDWLDTDAGSPQGGYRAMVYRTAVDTIRSNFEAAQQRGDIVIGDCESAARFWLEGILGHFKMASSENGQDRAQHMRWADRYVGYFFAGVRQQGSPGGPLG
ncbi:MULTISPECIES: TetR/AcrR family transcriptional regulator [unclassified Novosphingobium]|uniref:TetR/AcrR family transcriptional regulator n=1 Tax=unclassified Novosphingobium TaxID=2644732 RepID=UPI0017F5768C|nr:MULTISPECIES: TetR/AcrR family transcriptional regulator [unclassified Novosphingobium]NMN04126.1 AcrR family transcriptional regulator [Novosphingobium sp. SG919]NMN85884.1 AcrR family transcriptional regulator [Novosphingobium sp. SG916]